MAKKRPAAGTKRGRIRTGLSTTRRVRIQRFEASRLKTQLGDARKRIAALEGAAKKAKTPQGKIEGANRAIIEFDTQISAVDRTMGPLGPRAAAGDRDAQHQLKELIAHRQLLGARRQDAINQLGAARALQTSNQRLARQTARVEKLGGKTKRAGRRVGQEMRAREVAEKKAIAAEEKTMFTERDLETARDAEERAKQKAAADMKTERGKRQRVIKVAQSSIAKQKAAVAKLTEERNRLTRELEGARGDSARMRDISRQLSSTDRTLSATADRLRELEGQLEQAEEQRRAARSEAGRAGQRLGDERAERKRLEDVARVLEERLNQSQMELDAARTGGAPSGELQALRDQVDALTNELRARGAVVDNQGVVRAPAAAATAGEAAAQAEAARKAPLDVTALKKAGVPDAEIAEMAREATREGRTVVAPEEAKKPGSEKFKENVTNVGEGIRGFGLFGTGLMRDALYIVILALLIYFVAQLFSFVGML